MNKLSTQFRTLLSFVHNASRQHIIVLYGTPAVRQTVLRLAWYIRPSRFEDSIRKRIGRTIRFEIRFERKKTIRRSLVFLGFFNKATAYTPGRIFTQNTSNDVVPGKDCLLYTSPSPRDRQKSRMPSSA